MPVVRRVDKRISPSDTFRRCSVRNGDFEPKLLHKYETSSNELKDKLTALYAKGLEGGKIVPSEIDFLVVCVVQHPT